MSDYKTLELEARGRIETVPDLAAREALRSRAPSVIGGIPHPRPALLVPAAPPLVPHDTVSHPAGLPPRWSRERGALR